MFDFDRWADWACQKSKEMRQAGAQASFTCTAESRASTNPAFFVDFDTDDAVGRIIVWQSGDFDIEVGKIDSGELVFITDVPPSATNENFEDIFERFAEAIVGLPSRE